MIWKASLVRACSANSKKEVDEHKRDEAREACLAHLSMLKKAKQPALLRKGATFDLFAD